MKHKLQLKANNQPVPPSALNLSQLTDHIILCTGTRYDKFFRRVNAEDLPPCHIDVRGNYNQYVSLTIEPITKEMRKKKPTMTDELNIFERPPPMMQEHATDAKRAGFPEFTVSVFHLNQDVAKKPQVAHSALQRFQGMP